MAGIADEPQQSAAGDSPTSAANLADAAGDTLTFSVTPDLLEAATFGRMCNACDSRDSHVRHAGNASATPVTVCIHGCWYDLSNFDDHPGGGAFLKSVAGKDATTHFEAHHMRIERARERLAKLPMIRDCEGDVFEEWDWSENGFYATVRRRAAAALLENIGQSARNEQDVALVSKAMWRKATTSTMAMRVTRMLAVIFYLASFFATCATRCPWAAIACGMMTAVMGGFGHNAFHQRGRTWDCWLFECAGLSHTEWRVAAHTAHHMSPNLPDDPDSTGMLPFVVWGPPRGWQSGMGMLRCMISPFIFHIVAALAVLSMQGMHLFSPGCRKQDASFKTGLVVPFMMLCFLLLSGWLSQVHEGTALIGSSMVNDTASQAMRVLHSCGLWLLIWTSGSFHFMLVTNVTHNQEWNWSNKRDCLRDWGAWQLATATDIAIPFGLRAVPLCGMLFIFLHEQTLHHLFPTLDHSRLHGLRPLVQRTAAEFGLELLPPKNYLRMYVGMLATTAGISVSQSQVSVCRTGTHCV